MKDVMIDFETFGNGPNKCLCQVGAVFFDQATGALGAEFKVNIDAASHVSRGAVIDASTLYWWLEQGDSARASLLAQPRVDVVTAMTMLNAFLMPAERVWSHATFDFVTLLDTLRQLGIKPSVNFRAGMDLRTLIYLSGIDVKSFPRVGAAHDGLDDAKFQVQYTVAALNAIRKVPSAG